MANLATFEREVKDLRERHTLASGNPIPINLVNTTIYADHTPLGFRQFGRVNPIAGNNPVIEPELSKGLVNREERTDYKPRIIQSNSLSDRGVDLDNYYLQKNPVRFEYTYTEDITSLITPRKKEEKDSIHPSIRLHDYEEREENIGGSMLDIARVGSVIPLVMKSIFGASIEDTVQQAATHYANNRQGYIALALSEAFARGIVINLDTTVDAVNVRTA